MQTSGSDGRAVLDDEARRIARDGAAGDPVNGPSHYNQHAMECIEAIEVMLTAEQFRGFCLGNEIKYRWRAGDKGDASEDLDKADWYHYRLSAFDSRRRIADGEV